MDTEISKSRFKARALEYLRQVERTGRSLVITHRGKPVAKIAAYQASPGRALQSLRESVVHYDAPTEPVAEDDWELAR